MTFHICHPDESRDPEPLRRCVYFDRVPPHLGPDFRRDDK